jgi:hypothetical protein
VQAYLHLARNNPEAYVLRQLKQLAGVNPQLQAIYQEQGFDIASYDSDLPVYTSFTLPVLYLDETLATLD